MQLNPAPTLENLGGKGWHLHLLKKICTVPDFFVIRFDDTKEIENQNIQKQILEHFEKQNLGLVSVRSSATVEDGDSASFAGMFESVLNVQKENLIEAIKQVVNSVSGERVEQYCTLKGIDYAKVGMRVVVQKMINSEVSGVCFTKTPDNEHQMIIEACLGLGEALVSGKVTPDNYLVGRETLNIDHISVAFQKTQLGKSGYEAVPFYAQSSRKLEDKQIKELAETALLIERKLNMRAADIEWAYEGGKLYILQARAVTGFNNENKKNDTELPDINNFELTFEVSGLGFLFADMLSVSFDYMHPLFTISGGEFKQYFHNEKMDWAGKYGLNWLKKLGGFEKYETEFRNYHEKNFKTLAQIVNGNLNKNKTEKFFKIANKYHWYYSGMNTQFTNYITNAELKNKDTILANSLSQLAKFKDIAREWINQILVYDACLLNVLLKNLSKKFGIPIADLNNYKISEIYALFDGKQVTFEELTKRPNAVISFDGKETSYTSGDGALKFIKILQQPAPCDMILKGQVANDANLKSIEGTVRVLNIDYANLDAMHKQIEKMKKGEILVAKFTSPELLLAVKKAKAIITDLGGMLSHAAIISREFGIPCLIGTMHATQFFKTGDQIKIDFANGIIEKIKS